MDGETLGARFDEYTTLRRLNLDRIRPNAPVRRLLPFESIVAVVTHQAQPGGNMLGRFRWDQDRLRVR